MTGTKDYSYHCELADKLESEQNLTDDAFYAVLTFEDPDFSAYLAEKARAVRERIYHRDVYIRGLIEFTNYCKNNCSYCGIRGGNKNAERYRLSEEDILSCTDQGYELGFRTFVLQGGEDPYYTDERMVSIIRKIKERHPSAAITLSIGKKKRKAIRSFLMQAQTGISCAMKPRTKRIMRCFIRKRCPGSTGCNVSGICGRSAIRWDAA